MVASGSSRPMRAGISVVCQAFLKSRMIAAWRAVGDAGGWAARMRRRPEGARWREAGRAGGGGRRGVGGADAAAAGGGQLAAGGRGAADDAGELGEGIAEDVVED